MTCLSKDHDSVARTRLALVSSSKTNKRMWSPTSLTLNSFQDLQRGLKVLPIASTLRALLIRNLVVRTYYLLFDFFDFVKLILDPSISVKDSFFQSLRISFVPEMNIESEKENKARLKWRGIEKKDKCFPTPRK